MWSAEDIIVCNFWIYKILLLCCMNSVFRRLIKYILREALIVYWHIDAALIGIFFHDSFLFWNRIFCQTLFLDHAMQQKAKQHLLLLLKYFVSISVSWLQVFQCPGFKVFQYIGYKYFSILATKYFSALATRISVSWLEVFQYLSYKVFQYLGYKYFSILATKYFSIFPTKYFSILATKYFSILATSISVSWLQVFQYLGYKYFSILATSISVPWLQVFQYLGYKWSSVQFSSPCRALRVTVSAMGFSYKTDSEWRIGSCGCRHF